MKKTDLISPQGRFFWSWPKKERNKKEDNLHFSTRKLRKNSKKDIRQERIFQRFLLLEQGC